MLLMIVLAIATFAFCFALSWLAGQAVHGFLPKRVGSPWRTRAKWGTTGMVMLVFALPLLRGLAMWAAGRT